MINHQGIKILKYLATLFLIFLMLLCFILFTHIGNKITLKFVTRYEPRLKVELTQGIIFNTPHFSNLSWTDEETKITIKNLKYDFELSSLFSKLSFKSFDLEKIDIFYKSSEKLTKEASLKEFSLPIPFELKDINLSELYAYINGVTINLNRAQLEIKGKGKEIIASTKIDDIQVDLPKEINPPPTETNKELINKISKIGLLPALLNQDLPKEIYSPFDIMLAPLELINFQLTKNKISIITLDKFTARLNLKGSRVKINELKALSPEINLSLEGEMTLKNKYPSQFNLLADLKNTRELTKSDPLIGKKFKLKTFGDLSKLSIELSLSEEINATLKAELDLLTPDLPFKLNINWEDLQYPLLTKVRYKSSKGEILGSGRLSDYRINLNSNYSIEDLTKGEIKLEACGNLERLELKNMLIEGFDGEIKLNGIIEDRKWKGKLTLDKLNLKDLNTRYTGYISGEIKNNFTLLSDSNFLFKLPKINLYGLILDKEFKFQGSVYGNNKEIKLDDLLFDTRSNKISIDGTISKENNLKVTLALKDLSHLIFDLKGALKGEINLKGSKEIKAKLKGDSLSYQDNILGTLDLDGTFLLSKEPLINLSLIAKNLNIKNTPIDMIEIKTKPGDKQNTHKVDLKLLSRLFSTELEIEIDKKGEVWRSSIKDPKIQLKQGSWKLNKPLIILYKNKTLELNPHCWQASNKHEKKEGLLCLEKVKIGKSSRLKLKLNKYLIKRMNSYLASPFSIDGSITAFADIIWDENSKAPFVDFKLQSKDINLLIEDKQKPLKHHFEKLNFALKAFEQTLNFNGELESSGFINMKLEGEIKELEKAPLLNLKLDLNANELSKFAKFFPDINKLSGKLNSRLSAKGALLTPIVDGEIKINEFEISALNLPIEISNLNTEINFKNRDAILEGSFYTDGTKGKAIIKGKFDWRSEPKGIVFLSGEKLKINDHKNIDLLLSPIISAELNKKIKLKGKILVDRGKLQIRSLPENTIPISEDIIVLDRPKEEKRQELPLEIDLKLNLGEKFQVEALGLESLLMGNLVINKKIDSDITINGVSKLSKGVYKAFGQELLIQENKILFQGSATSPYIYLKAIRDPKKTANKVIAGVSLIGTPEELEIRLFSTPSMPQQEVLAYLTTGKALHGQSSLSNDNQLTNLLIAFGSGKSSKIMNNIGNKVGISDLTISSNNDEKESTVGISGKLSPKVSISYRVGIFDYFSVIGIDYEIFDNLFIEASSGLIQEINLYYKFDSN